MGYSRLLLETSPYLHFSYSRYDPTQVQPFNETVQPVIDVSQQETCFYSLCLKDILRLCKLGKFHEKDERKHLFPYDGNLNPCSKNTVNFIQCTMLV